MPLKAGKSQKVISENISEFHGGKTYAATKAKFGKAKADKQAVAVAMSNARRYAAGGRTTSTTFLTKDSSVPGGVGTVTYPGRAGYYGGSPETNPNLRPAKKAAGGSARVPGPSFFQRDANRALSRQSGLIKSVVPGRTDKHPMRVASGSYILPADVVSHLGQNNTLSGAKFLRRKFGGGGAIQFAAGGEVPVPVDIIAAGGEYVLSPDQVAAVGGGDLKKGHAALDKMVLDTRRDHIKTLRKLAPPKRS
jgi:hypothetical protein